MKHVFRYTFLQAVRQRYIQWMMFCIVLAFALVSWNGSLNQIARTKAFETAKTDMRKAWLNQGPQNPHSSGHYGHYVFQPVTAMQVFDQGIRPFAGSMLRLEAHKQNEPVFSPAQQRTEMSRFGDFSMAWVLQMIVPLFILLVGFSLVSSDRENNSLRLIAAQGVKPLAYLLGKSLVVISLSLLLLVLAVIVQFAIYALMGARLSSQPGWLANWMLAYALFYVALSLLSVAISAVAPDSRSSLTIQLAGWVIWMVVLPRITANMGAMLYPMEHRQMFNQALAEDRKKGIDGHNPADEYIKAFEDSLLLHYKVKDLESLPINADGLMMQADEVYSNMVYDKHFERIRHRLNQQNSIIGFASFINPLLSIKNLSMGLAQSDYRHHLQLLKDAEEYRRVLIKNLNETMAYGGSKTGDWEWTVDSTYWKTIPDFAYQQPSLATTVGWYKTEWSAMLWWLFIACLAQWRISKKLFLVS